VRLLCEVIQLSHDAGAPQLAHELEIEVVPIDDDEPIATRARELGALPSICDRACVARETHAIEAELLHPTLRSTFSVAQSEDRRHTRIPQRTRERQAPRKMPDTRSC
jgi:hypothetical protein